MSNSQCERVKLCQRSMHQVYHWASESVMQRGAQEWFTSSDTASMRVFWLGSCRKLSYADTEGKINLNTGQSVCHVLTKNLLTGFVIFNQFPTRLLSCHYILCNGTSHLPLRLYQINNVEPTWGAPVERGLWDVAGAAVQRAMEGPVLIYGRDVAIWGHAWP